MRYVDLVMKDGGRRTIAKVVSVTSYDEIDELEIQTVDDVIRVTLSDVRRFSVY